MISIKSKEQISCIQRSGAIAFFVLKELAKNTKPGVSTLELEKIATRLIKARSAIPSFQGYRGYKFATCISINDEVVHGIPSTVMIKEGDIVSIDVGVNYKGYYSDTATTVIVGRSNEAVYNLVDGTKQSLVETIKLVRPGIKVGDLESKTGEILKAHGISPVLALSGHGVGFDVHEDPPIKSDGKAGSGPTLKQGMVLAIEPMATIGTGDVCVKKDGWTVKTTDGKIAAHFEHTVAVTKNGFKTLTGSL